MTSINGFSFTSWRGSPVGDNDTKPRAFSVRTESLHASYVAAYEQLAIFRSWPSATVVYTITLADGTPIANTTVLKCTGVEIKASRNKGARLVVDWRLRPPVGWP